MQKMKIIVIGFTFEDKSLGTLLNPWLRYTVYNTVYSMLPLLFCSIGSDAM